MSIAFSLDGKRLATSGLHDKSIKIWNATSGTLELQLKVQTSTTISRIVFSPDGSQIASNEGREIVAIWDAVNGGELLRLHAGNKYSSITDIAYEADGRRLVSETRSGRSSHSKRIVWDTKTGETLDETIGDASMANSPDGRWLAMARAQTSDILLVDREFKNRPDEKAYREAKARVDPIWHVAQAEIAEEHDDWYAATFYRAWAMKGSPTLPKTRENLLSAYDKLKASSDKSSRDRTPYLTPLVAEMLKLSSE